MKFEGAGQFNKKAETTVQPSLPELERVANALQVKLARLASGNQNPEDGNKVMMEWVSGSAEKFRGYVDKHPHDPVDLSNEKELQELLHRIMGESDTLH